ncbi:GTPase domain-containing protein [uncultured Roseobacter sp.]|uniref:GTPase domain-containing protein n=1 Tax=uncultured Roseobacter sp. TaxID=114847 RepID=UPI00261CFE95|nr:GTPase domain-containing protein [uncultured Roseobacter sp.]
MLDDTTPNRVIAELEQALAKGVLTGAPAEQATQLLERLRTGVRVVVLGPKGVGKSQLCSVLLHQVLQPNVQAGAVTYKSGEFRDTAADAQNISMDHPLLQVITLTDTAPAAGAIDAAQLDAMKQADVVLWCTQEFSELEAEIWAQASDHLKDHSFLVLTKADQLAERGTLPERIAALQTVAGEEFHSFFPTSTFHAHQALCKNGEIPEQLLAASGVKALMQTLSNLATSGQRADLDNAWLFLQRNGIEAAQIDNAAGQGDRAPAEVATYEKALALLRARTPELTATSADPDELRPEAILACCGTLAEDLAEIAADETHSAPDFDAWRNDLYEASDKVVLMSLENDLRSAADAATIILQLTRDLEARLVH